MPDVVRQWGVAHLMATLVLGLAVARDLPASPEAASPLEPAQMQQWVNDMKTSPRGPFHRIRWFCADGTVLPPVPYACRPHGGGVQHGEWNAQAVAMRKQGYLIASLLVALDIEDFIGPDARLDDLRQILIERFLIDIDDGWVFRQARYYRGAIQVEDEHAMASRLMLALIEDPASRDPARFLLLREAARLLPLDDEGGTTDTVRRLASEIAERDPGFRELRIKLHGMPDAGDPQRVREYARNFGMPELAERYRVLVEHLDTLYAPQSAPRRLAQLAADSHDKRLRTSLQNAVDALQRAEEPAAQLASSAWFAQHWRRQFMLVTELDAADRLRLLQAGLVIEHEVYAIGSRLVGENTRADRLTRLQWLGDLGAVLYGIGLLSDRQRQHLEQRITQLTQSPTLTAENYARELHYLSRVTQWAQRSLGFHFDPTIMRWSDLTPLAAHYIPDRLRASPLLAYTRVLDTLLHDANALIGLRHTLFGQDIAGGLRALNPGLRRGVLLPAPEAGAAFRRDGIYLLPATTPELPPVAGILTREEGSSLSHVQLLARDLGIPNVVVNEALLSRLTDHLGKPIVLAVSPRGRVAIDADGPAWDAIFGSETPAAELIIAPDRHKLDLQSTALRPLQTLRADDSGRTVGPKAANLGELGFHYPQQVSRGIVIPFGVFREFLNQPITPSGPAAFDWLQDKYAQLEQITDPEQHQAVTRHVLEQLRHWIVTTDPGEAFRATLHAALDTHLGSADTNGLFVRSDTNVEDLPGFTGAGLNRTVPNVIGFEAIVQAIQQVWASPFSERAYAWRQAHMPQPEHVYPAVLLQETFPSQKSGVMATVDIDSGNHHWLTIAASEGIGGVVDGQAAEELRVHRATGELHLLAQASAPFRTEPAPDGGLRKVPASGRDTVLSTAEITQLRALANDLAERFPTPSSSDGTPVAMDIEFGFHDGRLALFQIRPLLDTPRARLHHILTALDPVKDSRDDSLMVDLRHAPGPHPGDDGQLSVYP